MPLSGKSAGGLLGLQAELGGLEGVGLGHGLLRAIEAIQNELSEETEANLARNLDVLLALIINKVELVAIR